MILFRRTVSDLCKLYRAIVMICGVNGISKSWCTVNKMFPVLNVKHQQCNNVVPVFRNKATFGTVSIC